MAPARADGLTVAQVDTAGIRLQIVTPPHDLAPFVTAFYRTEAVGTDPVEDWLPPEWANLRIGRGSVYEAAVGTASLREVPAAVLSGPTSQVTRLRIADGEFWGVGLLPLGWACFLGVSADDFADGFHDANGIAALAPLSPVIDHLTYDAGDFDHDLAVMIAGFRNLLALRPAAGDAIQRTHQAILSDRFTSVKALADELGTSTRTLERFARRHFGFAPKLLLRRQRFLRSLARFMVDPTMRWLDTLDGQYHDQAQFVRDFKHFMLMRPGEYAAMDHPIAGTAVRARRVALGDPMQVLHRPPTAAAPSKHNPTARRTVSETS